MEERGEKSLPDGVRLGRRLPELCETDLGWSGEGCGNPAAAVGKEVVISRVGMAAYRASQCTSCAGPSSDRGRFSGGCMRVV